MKTTIKSYENQLSLKECISILIENFHQTSDVLAQSNEIASDILQHFGKFFDEEQQEIAFFNGMDLGDYFFFEALASGNNMNFDKLVAALEIGKKYHFYRLSKMPDNSGNPEVMLNSKIKNATINSLNKVPARLRYECKEWIGFVPILNRTDLGNLCIVQWGRRTDVNFDPADLFLAILSFRPAAFFLFHNHPSGELNPSENDIGLTQKVLRVARELGIEMLGHAIITTIAEKWIYLKNSYGQEVEKL